MTYAGRVEARMTVPSAGAAVSASNGAQSAASTVTTPGASYYLTSAGGVSSLLDTFAQYLNDNVQGYPLSAAAMQAAVGYGTWTAGWLLNESSGNLIAAFGAPNLTAVSSPLYGATGPRGGIDKAVSFDSTDDAFSGGDVFDVNGTDDLVLACVVRHDAAGTGDMIGKWTGGSTGWVLEAETTRYRFFTQAGGPSNFADTSGMITGEWCALIAYIDRGASKVGLALKGLTSGTTLTANATFSLGDLSNAGNFRVGDQDIAGAGTNSGKFAYVAIGTGTSVAANVHTNIATAIANFANAVNSSFTVSFSTTTGRATISNSFWPSSVAFTNTTLRDVLGFEYNWDYPQTAAQLTTALGGYGNFTGGYGWLLNEASGNPAAIFGGQALTQVGSPTYSVLGPRGGSDKAITLPTSADRFTGSTILDVGATADLILVWVARMPSPSGDARFFSKNGGGGFWIVDVHSNQLDFQGHDGVDTITASISATTANAWHVGIAVLERATNKMRVAIQPMFGGSAVISSEVNAAALGSTGTGATFVVGSTFNGNQSNAALYAASGVGIATGLSANLSTAIASLAASMTSATGTRHCSGLWIPDCPFVLNGDARMAPKASDKRDSEGPTGVSLSLVGSFKRKHHEAGWSHVPIERVREESATYDHGSWEWFVDETQFGFQSTWFKPGSLVQIYDHAGNRMGQDANVAGWKMKGIVEVGRTITPAKRPWTGLWRIEVPELVAEGG